MPRKRCGESNQKGNGSRDDGKTARGAQHHYQQLQGDKGESDGLQNIDLNESVPGIGPSPAKIAQRTHGNAQGIPKNHKKGKAAKASCHSRAELQMVIPMAKRCHRKPKSREGHEQRSSEPATEEPIVVPRSEYARRGEKDIERMTLYHQDHREHTNDVNRNETRRVFDRQAQRLFSKNPWIQRSVGRIRSKGDKTKFFSIDGLSPALVANRKESLTTSSRKFWQSPNVEGGQN